MSNYYFLAASLPPLELDQRPELSFEELTSRLAINLNREDFEKTVVLRRLIDLYNIRALFLGESVDSRGNMNEKELDEALLIHNILPSYVFDFLDRFEQTSDKILNFPGLIATFFNQEIPKRTGFLRRYLEFERGWRLVLTALRSKELGRDVAKELQFEDFSDLLVAQILAQKDAPSYDPPPAYFELKEQLASCGPDPWQRQKVLAAWRFNAIEELVDKPLFSIDWILAYMARLIIVEYWKELDEKKGRLILEQFKTG
ncbi:MAG: DUF2764 family protein [Anaerolineae bacterium]